MASLLFSARKALSDHKVWFSAKTFPQNESDNSRNFLCLGISPWKLIADRHWIDFTRIGQRLHRQVPQRIELREIGRGGGGANLWATDPDPEWQRVWWRRRPRPR